MIVILILKYFKITFRFIINMLFYFKIFSYFNYYILRNLLFYYFCFHNLLIFLLIFISFFIMTEKTFIVTAFIDSEFEMFRVNEIVDGKPSSIVFYAKNFAELSSYLKK